MASSKFILRAEALLLMRAGAKAAALTREARTAMNLNMVDRTRLGCGIVKVSPAAVSSIISGSLHLQRRYCPAACYCYCHVIILS